MFPAACREIISIILQEDHDYNMRRGQRLTTILLSLLLVFTLLTTAFAESADMGVQSAPTQENTEESTGLQTAESSEEPAAGAEPEPSATADNQQPGASANAQPSPSAAAEEAEPVEEEMLLAPFGLITGADVTVNTWEDLKDSVEQADVDGKVIHLDPSLAGAMPATADFTIAHNNSVIIDGGGISLNAPSGGAHFRITNSGTGTVTLQNIKLDATGGSGSVVLSGGSAKLDNISIDQATGTAIDAIGTNAVTLTDVNVEGAATGVKTSAGTLAITGSSFKTITGTAISAAGAATLMDVTVEGAKTGVTGGTGLLTIDASEFKTIATTGITLGSGGADITDTTIDGVTNGTGISVGNNTLTLTGSTITNIAGVGVDGSGGNLTIDDCTFSESNGIGVSGGANATIKNTLFENVRNQRGGHGSAIYAGTNLTVEDSSFVNSASTLDSGYIQGAIVGYGGSGKTLNVTRSYFKDNKASRYGGAIGLYQYGGTVNVSYSYFEANGVSGKNANSDGGAIGVYNNSSSVMCTVNVDNNTFIGNTAQDDGSALFFEGRNDMVVANVTQNTFYGNKASKYLLAAADSGGVVQLSLDVIGHFKNNTFIGNTAPNYASLHGAGAAVGQHVDSANAAVRPSATFQNNIFVGNGGNGGNNYASRNVDIPDGTDLGGNIGYDNGTPVPADVTAESVFGTSPQPRANNTQYGAVGKEGSGHTGTLMTVVIQPNDGVAGQADNSAGTPVYSKDARGFTRDGSSSDAGAMEIKFVKFDANGGAWSGLSSLTYDGTKYYADDTASTGYFLVTDPGGSVSVVTSDLPANGALVFDGWYTQATGGTEVTGSVTATDQTLYAHWKTAATEYTVTYDGNGADAGTVPGTDTVAENTSYQVNTTPPTRAAHTFDGWKADDGTVYQAGATFTMPSGNVTLTAQWTPVPVQYTVEYDGNGSDGGIVPATDTYNSGATATISGSGTMSLTNHTFIGWDTNPVGGGTAYTEGQTFPITGNLKLYAQWQDNTAPISLYTLTFDSQGGTHVDPITNIAAGSKVSAPVPPTRDNHVFDGWHNTPDCTCTTDDPCWDFGRDTINDHKTLYARWQPASQPANYYTVTFDSQGGTGVDPITNIVPGSRLAAPQPPTRDGYVFYGWYQEPECVRYWFFDHYDVNESLTLYARWEPVGTTPGDSTDNTTSGTGTAANASTPKTGDDTLPLIPLIVAAAAAAGAIILVAVKKKSRQRQQ